MKDAIGRRFSPRALLASILGALLVACGGPETPVRTVSPPLSTNGVTTSTATPMAPSTPMAEAKLAFAASEQASDPREKCRLLREAVSLDQSLLAARIVYASSRCAPASELLDHARAVFSQDKSAATASILMQVGTRAAKREDAMIGAKALSELAGGDLELVRLAARTLARFGDHATAARLFEKIATERASKGSTHDALDARLDATMESARAGGKGGTVSPRADLLAAIDAAIPLSGGYGGAWITPKVVDAIAVLRVSGDVAGANDAVKAAREKKLVSTPEQKHLLDLERAIAEAREGKPAALDKLAKEERAASRVGIAASRALLAVGARVSKKCGAARAYARAHSVIPEGTYPRFDDDVAWARGCEGGELVATLARPKANDTLDDLDAMSKTDPVRGRALLQAYVDGHTDDPAARLVLVPLLPVGEAVSILDAGLKLVPGEPSLHFAKLDRLVGAPRAAEAAEIAKVVLPSAIEVFDDPRAAVPVIVELFAHTPKSEGNDAAVAPLATALLRACAAKPDAPACLPDKGATLADAGHRLRTTDPPGLALNGLALADVDLVPKLRLDVVIALVDGKQITKAQLLASPKRGKWDVVESGVAEAIIASAAGKCEVARTKLAQWPTLAANKLYEAEVARVKTACNLPP
jgi:hypothetical protein